MLNAWVMSRSMPLDLYSCDRVYKGFQRYTSNIKFVDLFDVVLDDNTNTLTYKGEVLTPPDVVVIPNAIRVPRLQLDNRINVESVPYDLINSYKIMQVMKGWNTLFVNELDAHADASNKWVTYNKLVNHGVPIARAATFPIKLDYNFKDQVRKQIILDMVGVPFVVKREVGFNGQGVEVCYDIDDFEKVCNSIWKDYRQTLIVQEYIEHSAGMIITVGVAGDEIFPVARVGDPELPPFKADIYAGRLQLAYKPTPELYDISMRTKEALNLDYLRFDMMIDKEGNSKIIEVNSPGGFNVTTLAHKVEFGFKMVDCAIAKYKKMYNA